MTFHIIKKSGYTILCGRPLSQGLYSPKLHYVLYDKFNESTPVQFGQNICKNCLKKFKNDKV